MRAVHTYVLRLLIDPDEPGMLRGALQPVLETAAYPFVGDEAVLALLRHVAAQAVETQSDGTIETPQAEGTEEGVR